MEDQVTRFKNKYLVNRSNTKRMTIRKPQLEHSPDNWKEMFGNFLHDISLKKKHHREKTMNHLQDPLIHENPLLIPCTTQRFKLELFKYLEGEQSVQEMMNSINFPGLKQEITPDQTNIKNHVQKLRNLKNHHSVPIYDNSTHTMQMKQQHLMNEGKFAEAQQIQQQLHEQTQRKIQVLRDFIQERIELRKKANQQQRLEEIKNIHFIKTFYDISNEYRLKHQQQQEQLEEDSHYFKKSVPGSKKLKQIYVNYDNVQPYVKHQGKHFDKYSYPSIAILKDTMNQQSKEYLQEVQQQKQKRFEDALKQVRKLLESQNIRFSSNRNNNNKSQPLDWQIDVTIASPKRNPTEKINVSQTGIDYKNLKDYVIAKKPFFLFTKRAKQDKNPKNAHGLITMFDLKLYDYIHNKKIYTSNPQLKQISDKFHTMIESKKEQEINTQLEIQIEQRKYQLNKMKRDSAPEQCQNDVSQYSDDQSLQSIYEVNLDMLYNQSHQLHKKLGESIDGGFAKRIKQIIKLEEVNQQCLKTNLEKLTKQKISI
ncbi:unnamed protein product [Paramecium primaurelia]|uniref:Uncharacterized protein n=1 Tax=Paramecium primaurelia TaxID=5886 RepID=A0A8S1PQC3_PARPR|nr:unnamed protein product [Paramecium primaurelia]